MWLLLLACSAPKKPPMVVAGEAGLRACSTAEIVAYRRQLEHQVSAPSRAALETRYDRALASWALCMTLRGQEGWSIPPILDEPARALVTAVNAPPRSMERVWGMAAAKKALPEATALLALQELEAAVMLASAAPDTLASVVAYACAEVGDGVERLCESEGDRGLAGLETLRALAFPSTDPLNPLTVSFREPVHESWATILAHPIPVDQTAPLPIAALPVGPGAPLVGSVGAPYLIMGPQGVGLWLGSPALVITPDAMSIDVPRPAETDWPSDVAVGPYLWVAKDTPLRPAVEVVLAHPGWHPILVGASPTGAPIALDVRWPTPITEPQKKPEGIVLPEDATVQDCVSASEAGAGSLFLLIPSP